LSERPYIRAATANTWADIVYVMFAIIGNGLPPAVNPGLAGLDRLAWQAHCCLEERQEPSRRKALVHFDLDGALVDSVYQHVLARRSQPQSGRPSGAYPTGARASVDAAAAEPLTEACCRIYQQHDMRPTPDPRVRRGPRQSSYDLRRIRRRLHGLISEPTVPPVRRFRKSA
jgi:hypothetical protein